MADWVDAVFADLRYATRGLRATPGFTAIAVLTLALGIGATTAIFSALNPILFEPLPYPEANRIVMIWETRSDGSRNDGTFGMYRELAERNRSLESIAVLKPWQPTLTGKDEPERLDGQRVSASYFHVLGAAPILGRDFQPSDDVGNGPRVVILSDALWRRRFEGDPSVVGRDVTLDDNIYSVVGVMPGSFENVLAPSAGLWAPLQYDMSQGQAWGHHLRTVGRLRAAVRVDQAAQELAALGQAVLNELRPVTYGRNVKLSAAPLQEEATRGVKPALLAILGAVILVLVVACVNVTNLVLARGVRRRGEFALRAALGAGTSRLIRQLLTESVLLAGLGGAVGMGVAVLGVRALVALSPPGLPRVGAIRVDGAVLAFGLGITTLVGLVFGMVPALQAARSNPQRDLQSASRGVSGGHRRIRSALVVAEVALALALLVGSGLLLRSLQRLFAVPVGFDSSRLLTMQVQTAGRRFDDPGAASRFFEQALDAVRAVPGVTSAAFTSQLPMSGDRDEYGVRVEPNPEGYSILRYAVTPGYLETMRIPLRRGRLLDERDRAGAPLAALITESFAARRFSGMDPIGQRLSIGPIAGYTIVGVVGDVKQLSLMQADSDAVYIASSQWRFGDKTMSLVIRIDDALAGRVPEIRRAVWSIDKDQPIARVVTMDDLLAASAGERRFALFLFEVFALAVLGLAAAGIYGVLAGSVAERTQEIGVRTALGASRWSILALVVRQGMTLTGLGVAIGLVAASVTSGAITSMLFGVSRLDPITYLGVIVLLTGVSASACVVPAWRAVRVDPASTLRAG